MADDIFLLQYHEQEYKCKKLTIDNQVIYAVNHNKRVLYITHATDMDGKHFWTAIPANPTINALVNALGKQIEKTFNP
jgi:hypothetical protein